MPNKKWVGTAIALYNEIQAKMQSGGDVRSDEVTDLMGRLGESALIYLDGFSRRDLTTHIAGKSYFAFQDNDGRLSRCINADLFSNRELVAEFISAVRAKQISSKMNSFQITSACYTLVMSAACIVDLVGVRGDRQTPGTFFQYLVTHLLARTLDVAPSDRVRVGVGTDSVILTMDLILDRGLGKPKYHVAIKNSTRERGSEFWAHQRILDKAFEAEPYVGVFVGLAETKLGSTTYRVDEICVPGQWRAYQQYISKISRFYYLDPPNAYLELRTKPPYISVKPFGDYFFEDWDAGEPTFETPGSTNDFSVHGSVEESG